MQVQWDEDVIAGFQTLYSSEMGLLVPGACENRNWAEWRQFFTAVRDHWPVKVLASTCKRLEQAGFSPEMFKPY